MEAAKRPLGIVALKLGANTIEPNLKVDKIVRLDKEIQFKFKHWSVDDEEAPANWRKIVLVNETKANMVFNVSTDGPFEIMKTKSNSGASHSLA